MLGWHQKMEDNVKDYATKGQKTAKLHTKENFNELEFNLNILKQLISDCEKKNIKVILITTLTHVAYRNALNQDQLKVTLKSSNRVAGNYTNVNYYNFLDNKEFVESDFLDGDHLNAKGAEKFSLILNKIINDKLYNE